MEILLNYILESAISLCIIISMYLLLFRRVNNHAFNRLYILSSLVFISLIPLLKIPVKSTNNGYLLPDVMLGDEPFNLIATITIYSEQTNIILAQTVQNFPFIKFLYIIGLAALLVRVLLGLNSLRIFKNGAHIERSKGYVLIDSQSKIEPFSFFKLLFINRANYTEDELNAIMHHEKAHIQLKHSIDNLLLELILIIQWFNPFAWLLKRYLKEVHEFQADHFTINNGINPTFYKKLLLSNAMGTRFAFGNNLNQSLIKKRLKMINNKISKSIGFIRIFTVLAVFSVLFVVLACEKETEKVYTEVDTMAEFPGGMEAVKTFIVENVNYTESLKSTEGGKVFVSFVVNKEGNVVNAAIERGINEELDNEALRVVSELPKWKPALKDGKKVNVKFTVPINFSFSEEKHAMVEKMPEFPGGMHAFKQYIAKNVIYPQEARKENITGKAFIEFNVSETGEITNVSVARSSGSEVLDKEAIRVVSSSPSWEPGEQRGKKIDVKYTLPVEFLMSEKGGNIVINDSKVDKEKMSVVARYENIDDELYVVGKVQDINSKAMEGAHVVIKGTTEGCVTDIDGNFKLKVSDKNRELVFSYVGKETFIWKSE